MLLTHPRTLQAIQNKEDKPKNRKTQNAADYSSNLSSQMNKFNSESNVLVKSMMEGSDIKMERTNRMVNQNINTQEEALRRRLESRGKSRAKGEVLR